MARAMFSSSSLLKTLISDGISFVSERRGLAASAESIMRRSSKSGDKPATTAKFFKGKRIGSDLEPWIPDPVSGYYRPANRVVEIDAAELRAMLLRPKA